MCMGVACRVDFCLLSSPSLRYPSRSVIFRTFFFLEERRLVWGRPGRREMQPILIFCWCLLASPPRNERLHRSFSPKLFVFQSQGGLNNKRQTTIPSRVARKKKKFQIKRENLNIWKFTFFDSIFTEYHFWLWWKERREKSWDDTTTTANNNTFQSLLRLSQTTNLLRTNMTVLFWRELFKNHYHPNICFTIELCRRRCLWEKKSDFSCLILGRSATVTFDVFINFGVLMCNKINEKKDGNTMHTERKTLILLDFTGYWYLLFFPCILDNLLSSSGSLTSCRPEKRCRKKLFNGI